MDRYECGLIALKNEDLLNLAQGYPKVVELKDAIDIVEELNDVYSITAMQFIRFSKTSIILNFM